MKAVLPHLVSVVIIVILDIHVSLGKEEIDISFMINALCNNNEACTECMSKMKFQCDQKGYQIINLESTFTKCYRTQRGKMPKQVKLCYDVIENQKTTVTLEKMLKNFPDFNQDCEAPDQLKYKSILKESMRRSMMEKEGLLLCLMTVAEGIMTSSSDTAPSLSLDCKGFGTEISERSLDSDEEDSSETKKKQKKKSKTKNENKSPVPKPRSNISKSKSSQSRTSHEDYQSNPATMRYNQNPPPGYYDPGFLPPQPGYPSNLQVPQYQGYMPSPQQPVPSNPTKYGYSYVNNAPPMYPSGQNVLPHQMNVPIPQQPTYPSVQLVLPHQMNIQNPQQPPYLVAQPGFTYQMNRPTPQQQPYPNQMIPPGYKRSSQESVSPHQRTPSTRLYPTLPESYEAVTKGKRPFKSQEVNSPETEEISEDASGEKNEESDKGSDESNDDKETKKESEEKSDDEETKKDSEEKSDDEETKKDSEEKSDDEAAGSEAGSNEAHYNEEGGKGCASSLFTAAVVAYQNSRYFKQSKSKTAH